MVCCKLICSRAFVVVLFRVSASQGEGLHVCSQCCSAMSETESDWEGASAASATQTDDDDAFEESVEQEPPSPVQAASSGKESVSKKVPSKSLPRKQAVAKQADKKSASGKGNDTTWGGLKVLNRAADEDEQDDTEYIQTQLAEAPQPRGIVTPMLPFQLEALTWMTKQEHTIFRGGLLADEMGMGKTLQAIA